MNNRTAIGEDKAAIGSNPTTSIVAFSIGCIFSGTAT